jgi:pimeloyl-ACP methyl ester carboxylesterase
MTTTHPTPSPDAFEVHRAVVRDNVELAYVREGVGGVPLVCLHGWPSTKRMWYRNIAPLAKAGFEVIVPDHRGFGDSPVPEDVADYADVPSVERDIHALVTGLGHERCVIVGHDWGCAIAQESARRHPEFVIRYVVFNGSTPPLQEKYEAEGITGTQFDEISAVADHLHRMGLEADDLMLEFDTAEKRRDYIKGFYTGRIWRDGGPVIHLAGAGNFSEADANFNAEPFEDAPSFRASMGFYESVFIPERLSEPSLLSQPDTTETMILFGAEDEMLAPMFTKRMEVAYRGHCVGPLLIEGAGHFPHWERPDALNSAVVCFCRDLL